MPSALLKAWALLAFSLLANARPRDQAMADRFAIGTVDDWASSGNYLIYSCRGSAPDIRTLLDLTYLYLQTAMLSTETPAYQAFFHAADPAPLTTVLDAITAGINITTPGHGSRRPTVICANPYDMGIRSLWNLCDEGDGERILMQPPGTALVIVCPAFLRLPQSPQPSQCRGLDNAATQPSKDDLAWTQYGMLVEALVDMYIRETMPGIGTLKSEVRDENACLALPSDQALRNSPSYMYFVSNVRAGCTKFSSNVAIQPDRELLSTDGASGGNGTGLVTVECVSNGTASSSCP